MSRDFIRTDAIMSERFTPAEARELDRLFGNEQLLYGLDLLNLAGPFHA